MSEHRRESRVFIHAVLAGRAHAQSPTYTRLDWRLYVDLINLTAPIGIDADHALLLAG
jgi:hypothetical protein